MFSQLSLLFTSGTIEDDRDMIVLATLCSLIDQKHELIQAHERRECDYYFLGQSLDSIYAALPLTFGIPTKPASASSFSRNQTYISSPGQPGPCWRGARFVELL